jgi:hypothetical protein
MPDVPTNVLGEYRSLRILREAGLPAVRAELADSFLEVRRQAREIGFPVVMKTANQEILHKSDVGGVITNIANLDDLDTAYADLESRLGPLVLIQPQITLNAGVELFLGATNDPQFGPLVTVGFGGTLIEILADTLSYLAPVVAAEVRERLPNLRGFAILEGARGKPAVDLDGLAQLVSDFSLLACDLAREGLDIDVNPVFASGKDFLILDALIVPASQPVGVTA